MPNSIHLNLNSKATAATQSGSSPGIAAALADSAAHATSTPFQQTLKNKIDAHETANAKSTALPKAPVKTEPPVSKGRGNLTGKSNASRPKSAKLAKTDDTSSTVATKPTDDTPIAAIASDSAESNDGTTDSDNTLPQIGDTTEPPVVQPEMLSVMNPALTMMAQSALQPLAPMLANWINSAPVASTETSEITSTELPSIGGNPTAKATPLVMSVASQTASIPLPGKFTSIMQQSQVATVAPPATQLIPDTEAPAPEALSTPTPQAESTILETVATPKTHPGLTFSNQLPTALGAPITADQALAPMAANELQTPTLPTQQQTPDNLAGTTQAAPPIDASMLPAMAPAPQASTTPQAGSGTKISNAAPVSGKGNNSALVKGKSLSDLHSLLAQHSDTDITIEMNAGQQASTDTQSDTNAGTDLSGNSALSAGIAMSASIATPITDPISGMVSKGDIPTIQSNAQNPVEQVVDGAVYSVKHGQRELILKLNPDNLGQVRINLVSSGNGNQLSARFIATTAESHQLLKGQVDALKTSLESQGIQIQHLSVMMAGQADTRQDFKDTPDRQPSEQDASKQNSANGEQPKDQAPGNAFTQFAQAQQQPQYERYLQKQETRGNGPGRTGSDTGSETASSTQSTTSNRNDNGKVSILA